MTTDTIFSKFTHQYQLSKTLRFELIPVGETLTNIENKGLLHKDELRADSYKKMKKTIDEYHKFFIDKALSNAQLTKLIEYRLLYETPKEKRDEKAFTKVKEDLRKEIVAEFKTCEAFDNLFSAELIKQDLQTWVNIQKGADLFPNEHVGGIDPQDFLKGKDELYFDVDFKNFTTYFTGFHENRKNMYSADDKATAIAFRLIHENLPKFIDNIHIYNSIKENYPDLDFTPILTEMQDVLQGQTIDSIFSLDYFNKILTQKGISIINDIIGGKTEESKKKVQGLNEYINLYNQQQKDKKNKVPKFKQLYKQILSDRDSISYLPQAFDGDNELLESIENYYQTELCCFEIDGTCKNVLEEVKALVKDIQNYDTTKIFLRNDTGITTISQRIYGDFGIIANALNYYYENVKEPQYAANYSKAKTEKQRETLEKKKDKITKQDFLSINLIQTTLDQYISRTYEPTHEIRIAHQPDIIIKYFSQHFKARDIDKNETKLEFDANIKAQYLGVKGLLNIEKTDKKSLAQDKDRVHQIKEFLDSILELNHFVKPLFVGEDAGLEKDNLFYGQFGLYYQQLNKLIPLYNMVRNYLTQKPYSTEKIKLNFENVQLLGGWDENKEPDYLNVLLRKDGLYFLAIMEKKSNTIFENAPLPKNNEECYEKIIYKLLPGANKMLPKVFFAKNNIEYFKPSAHIQGIRNRASHSKNGEPQKGFIKADFNIYDCHALIDFFKTSLAKHEDWQCFNFKFSPTSSYEDLSGFYREVEQQGYKIAFDNISVAYINEKVKEGKLYLFKLYNKDFSEFSKGKPNMHTKYWKALFDEKNIENVVYKLNGQAEMFYRKASIGEQNKITHNKNLPIKAKNLLTPNNTNTFEYDIIKDRRFTIDKFQFHVPITLNFKATGSEIINTHANEFLHNNQNINIIGLDRGERNLIYLTLIDQRGNILHQESLNEIKDEKHNINTPYHKLLDQKETDRAEARQSWGTIETIKELKEGYISQVVHKIATMMVERNAIVVMEDLNYGFKRGRFKVEKQVYQKLEKMLIDKLNYLVFKDYEPTQPGGLMNALQLTNKFESFKNMGKQSGFLFYVPAWNTSKIDPTTGFVDFLKPKYESVVQAQEFLGKFESILFNPEKKYFEFAIKNYTAFNPKADGTKQDWKICTTNFSRYVYNKNKENTIGKGGTDEILATQELELLFGKAGIVYGNGACIKKQIVSQQGADFYKRLLFLLKVVLSLRYNNGEKGAKERDFIMSPVANEDGIFYNSETADKTLPKDADANGAYNIALKGLWVLEQIRATQDLKELKLAIRNKEWLNFIQEKNYNK